MTKGGAGIVVLLVAAACGGDKDGEGGATSPAPARPDARAPVAPAPPVEPAKPAPAVADDGLGDPARVGFACIGYTADGTVAVVLTANETKHGDDTMRLEARTTGAEPPFAPVELRERDFEVGDGVDDERSDRARLMSVAWPERSAEARKWIAGAELEPCASKRIVADIDDDYVEDQVEEKPATGWEVTVGGTPVKVNDAGAKLTIAVGGGKPRTLAKLEQGDLGQDGPWESIRAIYWHDKSPLLVILIRDEGMGMSEYTVHATEIR